MPWEAVPAWSAPLLVLACGLLDRFRGGGLVFLDVGPLRGREWPYLSLDQKAVDVVLWSAVQIVRGRPPFPPTPHLLYGWAVAALCGYGWDGWLTVAIVAGWVLGERPGWGAPIGQARGVPDPDRRPEWWQVGPLRTHPWAALVVRGAMWGLPVLAFTAPLGEVVWQPAVAMALAMPAAELAAMRLPEPCRPRSWAGAWNEVWRGLVFGALLWLLTTHSLP